MPSVSYFMQKQVDTAPWKCLYIGSRDNLSARLSECSNAISSIMAPSWLSKSRQKREVRILINALDLVHGFTAMGFRSWGKREIFTTELRRGLRPGGCANPMFGSSLPGPVCNELGDTDQLSKAKLRCVLEQAGITQLKPQFYIDSGATGWLWCSDNYFQGFNWRKQMFATCYCVCRMMTEWYKTGYMHDATLRFMLVLVLPILAPGTEVKLKLFISCTQQLRVRPVSEKEAMGCYKLN